MSNPTPDDAGWLLDEYDAENTKIVHRRGRRVRYCIVCLKASKRRSYLRRKAA